MIVTMVGGTDSFYAYLLGIADAESKVIRVPDRAEKFFPEGEGEDHVYFLLPRYADGESSIPEMSFELVERWRRVLESGSRIYLENAECRDYLRLNTFGLETIGNARGFFQEYLEYKGEVLQSRNRTFFPSTSGKSESILRAGNFLGTHSVSRKGTYSFPILVKNGRAFAAASNLTAYDSLFMRPYSAWKRFHSEFFGGVLLGADLKKAERVFESVFPEKIAVSGNSDPSETIRRALSWHWKSGVLRAGDGSKGVFEMIRSDNLGVRGNLRTDVTFLTAALFAAAGNSLGEKEFVRTGVNLADFLLDRRIQLESGFLKWFDHCDTVWCSDAGRCGLGLWNLWRETGEERFHSAALRLARGFLRWFGEDGLCCGWFESEKDWKTSPITDNPVYYAECSAFLLMTGDPECRSAVLKLIDRIGETFPDVAPFGFSDNFTFARWLLMLSCAQACPERDFSKQIMRMLEFFHPLQHESGGIAESPIRLVDHNEAGVGMGDGTDRIADLLYCGNFVFNALSVLRKLSEERRGTIDFALVMEMYGKLRNFLMRIQIRSSDPRLDGGWMRAFDLERGEYYGLNKDNDWGAGCIMGGWVMGFLPLVLLDERRGTSFFL